MSNPKWFDSMTDWIAGQMKEAATDIRRRAVEEPWFGKPLDGPTGGKSGEGGPSVEFSVNGSAWDWQPDLRATEALQKPSHDPTPEGPHQEQERARDKGIDL